MVRIHACACVGALPFWLLFLLPPCVTLPLPSVLQSIFAHPSPQLYAVQLQVACGPTGEELQAQLPLVADDSAGAQESAPKHDVVDSMAQHSEGQGLSSRRYTSIDGYLRSVLQPQFSAELPQTVQRIVRQFCVAIDGADARQESEAHTRDVPGHPEHSGSIVRGGSPLRMQRAEGDGGPVELDPAMATSGGRCHAKCGTSGSHHRTGRYGHPPAGAITS